MRKADFVGIFDRNAEEVSSKVSQKLVKTRKWERMSTKRGGKTVLGFD